MAEKSLLKLGAVSAMVGAIGAAVTNLMHPRFDEFSDQGLRDALTQINESTTWDGLHVGIAISLLLIVGGIVALLKSISSDTGRAIGRFAYAATVLGAGTALAGLALDGYVTGQAADAWVNASGESKEVAFVVAQAVSDISWGIFMMYTIALLSAAPILLGMAIAFSDDYPKWLGWAAVVGGALSLFAGLHGLYNGPTTTFFAIFNVSSGVVTVLVFVLGVLLWRKAAPVTQERTPT